MIITADLVGTMDWYLDYIVKIVEDWDSNTSFKNMKPTQFFFTVKKKAMQKSVICIIIVQQGHLLVLLM